MENERVVIRLNSSVSFAGVIVEILEHENGKIYVLKPSDNSNVLIHVPEDEIEHIYGVKGKVM